MIDPKELRIGSHILVSGKRVEIESITNDSQIGYYLPNYDDWGACDPCEDWVEPIPITEELLTELGFEKKMSPTFPPRPYYIDAESAKLKAEGVKLVEPRIAISYAKVEFPPFWYVEVHCEDMSDNRMAVRYLHELEQFLYLTTKTELIKE